MTETHDRMPLSEPTGAGRLPIGTGQLWLARSTVAAIVIVGVVGTLLADISIVVIPDFSAILQTAMFVVNATLAVLLFIKGESEQRGDATRLGAAYLYVALSILALMASFPGGLMPMPLIGSSQNSIWLWWFWHIGFGMGVIHYAWFARQPATPAASWRHSVIVISALVLLLSWIVTSLTDRLPMVSANGRFLMWGSVGVVTLAALVSVLWLRVTTSGRLWLIVGLVAGCLEVWLEFRVSARFTLAWYLGNMAGLVVSLAMLISLLYEITQICGELAASNAMLEKLVQLDALTELFNRRGFEARLQEEFRRARRLHLPLSVVMVDIDFFRSFNDRYGHQLGDECLRRVSSAIKAALWRPGDHAARYGGDVIAILLPSTDLLGAIMIGQRVRSAVAELALPHVGGPWQTVTVSAGVGSMLPQDASHSAADLLAAAEHALNQAKQEGRNRICVGTADLVAITQQDRPALASQEV